jgi:hypothetical protein
MTTQARMDLYERQLWEMRAAGLDSDVWVIGEGPIDYWGPGRLAQWVADFPVMCQWRMTHWRTPAHPMTVRWLRA